MADESALQPRATRLHAFSELPEILAAALIAFSLVPVNKNRLTGVLIAIFLILSSVVLKLVAAAREKAVLKTRVEQDGHEMHVITAHRMKTLKTVGAGEDVIEVLQLRLDQPMSAEKLVKWLEEELGRERMQEKIEIVRRYTRMN